MHITSKDALIKFLADRSFRTVLDAPCGAGWLAERLGDEVVIDGVDLYEDSAKGYRKVWKNDLDDGLPEECGGYDLICCCEGLEHVGNPLRLLRDFAKRLNEGGTLIVTTPNVWFPQARLQYLLRGFFPSFPPLADKVKPGTHMHIMPWSWPQLYVYYQLAGLTLNGVITEPQSRGKHFHERLFAMPARAHARSRARRAKTDEERSYWETAATDETLLSRHLMVHGRKQSESQK